MSVHRILPNATTSSGRPMSSRPSDILTAAFPVGEALFCVRQDQMRGENIFDGETQRFEYRNLVIVLPCR